MVSIDRAMAISDYDCRERRLELTWLAHEASLRRVIAEVGSYKGCTARAMADNTAGRVLCVDSFEGSVGEKEMADILAAHGPDWLYNLCEANLADCRNADVLRMHSLEAARMLQRDGASFDMVFLDASHDYDSVAADIRAWAPLLRPGGLLCGHDRQWYGVAKAIDELVPGHRVGVGAIWYRP